MRRIALDVISRWLSPTTLWRLVGLLSCLLLAVVVLPGLEAEEEVETEVTARVIARRIATDLDEAVGRIDGDGDARPVPIHVSYQGPASAEAGVRDALLGGRLDAVGVAPSAGSLTIHLARRGELLEGQVRLDAERLEEPFEARQTQRVGGWEAVLPPLVAILIALWFKSLLPALGGAVWLGASLQTGLDPFAGLWKAARDYGWGSVSDPFNLYIIAFTLALVGMVQVITRAGGVAGVLDALAHLARSARSTRVATALMGGAIFFDDYANTVVVGTTMRPLCDARGISREKLAYLVDSTSAPIAGVAIISTWIGYEVGLFGELSAQLGLGMSGYDIFFAILPLRFYCLFTLGFVLFNAWLGRDFGPMLTAERRAMRHGQALRPGARPLTSAAFARMEPAEEVARRWYNAVIPVLVVVVGAMLGMFWSGWVGPGGEVVPSLWGAPPAELSARWAEAAGELGSWQAWREAFSHADNARVLFWASMLGSAVAIGMVIAQRLLSPLEALKTWLSAVPAMWLAVVILVLAWAIRGVCDDLGTSIFLVGAVQGLLSPLLLPLVTFALAAIVAFATGTSWGTMGILLPAMIPMAYLMTEGVAGGEAIVLLCFGAVLDGAIFGDHCSPISDTTVMSSIASACDHLDHVRTQLPYAATTMLMAALFGYVGVAYGLAVWQAYGFALAAAIAVLYGLGRRADEG